MVGEPGDSLLAGDRKLRLSGLPQTLLLSSTSCDTLPVAWRGSDVPPFVQVRARRSDTRLPMPASAGLAFDGGVSDGIGVFHVWYRNPSETPVPGGSELRLYRAREDGLIDATSPTQSVAWWLGPIELSKALFTDRFEFDAAKLQLNGEHPLEPHEPLDDGGYVLTLNVSQRSDDTQKLHFRRVIPVLQVTLQHGRPTYRPLSGISRWQPELAGRPHTETHYPRGALQLPSYRSQTSQCLRVTLALPLHYHVDMTIP